MKVSKVRVHDIDESIEASKYPMSVDVGKIDSTVTQTVQNLAQSGKGEGHDQFLTGCLVSFDLTCSNKMWVEMERYRFVFFVSSQSTMHRASKFNLEGQCNKYVNKATLKYVEELQEQYNATLAKENNEQERKDAYLELLYNLPSGFEITARLTTNYRALKTIYGQRKNHRLPEWRTFCKWIETLPHAEFIVGDENAHIADHNSVKDSWVGINEEGETIDI